MPQSDPACRWGPADGIISGDVPRQLRCRSDLAHVAHRHVRSFGLPTGRSSSFFTRNCVRKQSPMPQINGGQALIRALEMEGVEVIFGLPGGAILPVYDPIIAS